MGGMLNLFILIIVVVVIKDILIKNGCLEKFKISEESQQKIFKKIDETLMDSLIVTGEIEEDELLVVDPLTFWFSITVGILLIVWCCTNSQCWDCH